MPKIAKAKRQTHQSEDWFFGPPPLLPGDDADAYRELLKQVIDTLQPSDIFERIWIRDVVDLSWDVLRWRREKAKLIKVTDTEHLKYLDKTPTMLKRLAQVDELIGWAEARRNIAYHELKQHRMTFAASLRKKMQEIEGRVANENSCQAILELTANSEYSAPAQDIGAVEQECQAEAEQFDAADEAAVEQAEEELAFVDETPADAAEPEGAEES
jgi:hypothetical protein